MGDHRTRFTLALGRAAVSVGEALLALVDYAADRAPAPAVDDPLWGRVDAAHLPAWISPDQFRDACAARLIPGAVKVGRAWTAPRHEVEAWALAGAKASANDDEALAERAMSAAGMTRAGRAGGG